MERQPETTQQSDASLIAACRRGDGAAWEALVRRYQRLIYSIALRSGLREDAAADVFQHVWTALFEKLDTLQQPERVGAWLATTARRETWRIGRGERAAAQGDDAPLAEAIDDAPQPDELVEQLEAQHAVRHAVDALDERCRALLQLLFYTREPPAYSTIAARLGVAEGSIGPFRARCLKRLQALLRDDGMG